MRRDDFPQEHIAFTHSGSGPAVVLIHGGAGSAQMWEIAGYVAALEREFLCVRFDLVGRGASGKPRERQRVSIPSMAEDLVRVLDFVGVRRAAVWGYSTGARVAVAAAASYPERVWAVVGHGLADRNPPAEVLQATADLVRAEGVAAIVDSLLAHEPDAEPLRKDLAQTDPEVFAWELEDLANATEVTVQSCEHVRAPTLLLAGDQEPAHEAAPRLAGRIASATIATVPERGHLGAFWAADDVLRRVLPFLREHSAATK